MAVAPPEGGYGWIIVGCFVTHIACVIQVIVMMGLVLKDVFQDLDISDSQGATIMTTTQAVSLGLGVLVGPLIRRFGFRLVAVVGAALSTTGLALTSTATTYHEFLIYFSILMALGMSLGYPSHLLAFSVYFKSRRTLAMAVALTISGVLATVTPLIISAASWYFSPRPAILVLSGIVMQNVVSSTLLRPLTDTKTGARPKKEIELTALDERPASDTEEAPMLDGGLDGGRDEGSKPKDAQLPASAGPGVMRAIVSFFDLGLLRNPSFVCLLGGASLGLYTDINLVQFLPFILGAIGYSTRQAAVFMSVFSLTDTVCRLGAPILHRACGWPSRVMYLATLGLVMVTRTALLWCRSYTSVMAVVALTGASRGINVVFLQTLVPDNVPIERLPSAQGLYMLGSSIIFMAMGPLMAWMLEKTGDYNVIIVLFVVINAVTVVVMSTEFLLVAIQKRRGSGRETVISPS